MTVLIVFALAVFGMILGSFAIATVWRLHGQEERQEELDELLAEQAEKPAKARAKKIAGLRKELRTLSISQGRSMCSHCRHPLAPKDLVPLFSWLWLRGKCRYCREPIEDTPVLEALLPVAFILSYLFWPLPFHGYGLVSFGFWLIFLTAFAVLTIYDLRWYLLPDRIVWPLVGLASLQVLLHIFVFGGGMEVFLQAFWGVATASGIFFVLYQVSKGEWIGGGDVKLGIVLGLLVGGPLQGLMLLFTASLLGTLTSLPMLLRHKLGRQSVIPFGPFLMLATCILVLFGQRMADALNAFIIGSI